MTEEQRKEKIIDKIMNNLSSIPDKTIYIHTLYSLAKKELFTWTEKDLIFYCSFIALRNRKEKR